MLTAILITMTLIAIRANYITNSGFENPAIHPTTYALQQNAGDWYGNFEIIGSSYFPQTLFTSQYVDLDIGDFGWIAQDINIPASNIFILTYDTSVFVNRTIETFKIEIYLNDELICTEVSYNQ